MDRWLVPSLIALSLWIASCSRSVPPDEARPVATPALSVTPTVVASGSPMEMTVRFAVAPDAPPFTEDLSVFVHVIDQSGKLIGTADHTPPTPTTQWKPGATIEYRHSAYAPTTRYVGPATVAVGLYSPATGRRVPLGGEAVEPRAMNVGSFELRERSDPYTVVFREGWHEVEAPPGSGVEYRWSTKSGRLSFANPNQDVVLVLGVEQPAPVFPYPQHVEVRIGEAVVDEFDLMPPASELRRIALARAQLGEGKEVDMALVSDKTFVPARIVELNSSDTRQLGVRVFRAYVEPKQ